MTHFWLISTKIMGFPNHCAQRTFRLYHCASNSRSRAWLSISKAMDSKEKHFTTRMAWEVWSSHLGFCVVKVEDPWKKWPYVVQKIVVYECLWHIWFFMSCTLGYYNVELVACYWALLLSCDLFLPCCCRCSREAERNWLHKRPRTSRAASSSRDHVVTVNLLLSLTIGNMFPL